MASTDEPNEEGIHPPGEPGPRRRRRFVPKSEMASTGEPNKEGILPPGESGGKGRRRFKRTRALADRLLQRPRSKRGLLFLLLLVGGIGSVVTVAGFASLEWSETAGFCARCHTMGPEVKANKLSPHRDVPCAECHVKPGVAGFVEAKANGAKQALEVLTGSYPKPIPKPEHALLPPVKDTCMRCHSLDDITKDGNPTKVVLRPRYRKDRSNTREMVAVVVRPRGLGNEGGTRGAHWHVEEKVEFASRDHKSRKIDWVGVTYKNGRSKQFIARSKVSVSSDVRPDIARVRRFGETRQMDCIDCHNRVGHDIPNPDRAIDEAIAAGRISQDLPYIKREGVSRTSASYPSTKAADRAIGGIRKTYAAKYPLVLENRGRAVSNAVDELKRIYRLVGTPEMKVTSKTYPSNLGHRTATGCFRCHDGGHFQVAKGRVLKKTIPWSCTTCHTFPQVGSKVTSVPLTSQPAFHEPGANILLGHSALIRTVGRQACSACHQQTFCARCHKGPAPKAKAAPVQGRRAQLNERDRE